MSVPVSAYQHAKPYPIDNIGAPKGLTAERKIVFKMARAGNAGQDPVNILNPKTSAEYMNNLRVPLIQFTKQVTQ